MKKILLLIITGTLAACSSAPTNNNSDSMASSAASSVESSAAVGMSPRHHEWVQVENGDRTVHTWVVYPEREDPAPVVMVIHENRGLNDWAREMADQLAAEGYIAVAPDLLSEFSEEYNRTSDFPDADAARSAIYELPDEQVQSDLQAVAAYTETIPSSNGQLAAAGFCWGGARAFQLAADVPALDASLVFYGTAPEEESVYDDVAAPVYGFYGGDDERVNATIDTAETRMADAGKTYDYEIYEGAGHAFMRTGEDAPDNSPNAQARKSAWERMLRILSTLE